MLRAAWEQEVKASQASTAGEAGDKEGSSPPFFSQLWTSLVPDL